MTSSAGLVFLLEAANAQPEQSQSQSQPQPAGGSHSCPASLKPLINQKPPLKKGPPCIGNICKSDATHVTHCRAGPGLPRRLQLLPLSSALHLPLLSATASYSARARERLVSITKLLIRGLTWLRVDCVACLLANENINGNSNSNLLLLCLCASVCAYMICRHCNSASPSIELSISARTLVFPSTAAGNARKSRTKRARPAPNPL